jgi:hypothetical protein
VNGFTRRRFGASALAGAATLGKAPPLWADELSLDDMVRVMARTDGGMAIRWTKGVLSGIADEETTQLLGVSQQIYSRHVRQPDGSFEVVYLELVYFTDLKTGVAEEIWRNPYTGRDVTVPRQILGPVRFKLGTDFRVVNQPYAMDGIRNSHWLEPVSAGPDEVAFDERIESYVPPMTEGGASMTFHEVFSFRAPRAAVMDSQAAHVPSSVYKINVISWRNWMDMAGHDGVTLSHGAGHVITDYAKLPADLAAKNAEHFPDVIEDIEGYLEV